MTKGLVMQNLSSERASSFNMVRSTAVNDKSKVPFGGIFFKKS